MERIKRFSRKLIFPLLIIIIIVIMSSMAYRKILKAEEKVCWETLENTTNTINREIESRFQDNISILKLAANSKY